MAIFKSNELNFSDHAIVTGVQTDDGIDLVISEPHNKRSATISFSPDEWQNFQHFGVTHLPVDLIVHVPTDEAKVDEVKTDESSSTSESSN